MVVIDINLNKADNKYIAGEFLQGTVTIHNEYELSVRSVYILITGVANVNWTAERNRSNETFESREQYLNSKTVLFGAIDGPTIKFPAGQNFYQFSCDLPEKLPGTMKISTHCGTAECSKSEIRYKVQLVIDLPLAPEIKEEKMFTVQNIIDLNRNPALLLPVQVEELKEFKYCCFADRFSVSASVPQGGYVPNENIRITCQITNEEGAAIIDMVVFSLVRKETAIAVTPSREVKTNEVVEAACNHQLKEEHRNKSCTFTKELRVPPCNVSMRYATYIRTEYYVQLQFFVQVHGFKEKLRIPIEIGSIGLSGPEIASLPLPPTQPALLPLTHIVPNMTPSAPLPENVPLLVESAPPSYEEVTKRLP